MHTRDRDGLAQYFTPEAVVRFAFDALEALGMDAPRTAIDPACGDGEFLLEVRRRYPEAEVWGTDVDGRLESCWRERGLVGGRVHMSVRDGLAVDRSGGGRYDLVVGNPPYGLGMSRPKQGEPIEAQFLRSFVAMARDGGWVAVIVPEGILANVRQQRIRDETLRGVNLRAVVALPESTFASTSARTSLVIGRKGTETGDALLAQPCGDADLGDFLSHVLEELAREIGGQPCIVSS